MKSWAEKFYKSKAWKECRESYITIVHGLCERCGQPGKIVHHKEILIPENINDPYVSFNWDKLEYLCQDCHNKEHHACKDKITRDGLVFNKYGELVESTL
jgi:5-methylcytosine-specific restriction endonuclease McrA